MNHTVANDTEVDWFTYAALLLLEKQGNHFPSQQDIDTATKRLIAHLVKQIEVDHCAAK